MTSAKARSDADVPPARSSASPNHLFRLRDLAGFEIAEGEPDPRGWDVFSASGTKVGVVAALIVEPQALKVRYLDVILDRDELGIEEEERHVLVPIGYATLAADIDRVRIASVTTADFRTLPAYDERPVTRRYEEVLRAHFEDRVERAERARRARAEDFYEAPCYDDSAFLAERHRRDLPNEYLLDKTPVRDR